MKVFLCILELYGFGFKILMIMQEKLDWAYHFRSFPPVFVTLHIG